MRLINIDQLEEGMQLGQDIYDEHNRLLLGRGAAIRGSYVIRLREIGLPALYVQDDDTSDIQLPQPIPPVARAKAIQTLSNTFSTVSKSLEGFRQVSVDEAHQHIRSPKFMDSIKSITAEGGLDQMVGDVDGLIDRLMNREVILGLNSIKTHDSYTFQHSLDVAIMGVLLARKFGWEKDRLTAFGVGCLLHDLGKIFIGQTEFQDRPMIALN